jgi:hypothetical protein
MLERKRLPTKRDVHRKLRAVDSEMAAKAANACALAHGDKDAVQQVQGVHSSIGTSAST